jgi:biotin carboxylase
MLTILCIATYLKGEEFLRACRGLGCRVLLLTAEPLADAAWPREAIDEMFTVPRDADELAYKRCVDGIARKHRIDRIAALDDFDVETGAMLREHLQIPGFGRTAASRFRDKLAMRVRARDIGVAEPEFTPVVNDAAVRDWTARVAPPWVLKPRSFAAAIGIRKIESVDALPRALDAVGDNRSAYVLEQFVQGDVYHVDSIVWNDEVVFAVAFKYGRPPMEIAHEGGVFSTRRLADDSDEARALLDANRRLQSGLGLSRGVSHTEFIGPRNTQSPDRRDMLFLETSARVGGAFIVDTIEAATGINLWREWAAIAVAADGAAYAVPDHRRDYAGIVLSLARQTDPDTSAYTDREIRVRLRKHHHAGLIVASPDPQRIETLIAAYAERFGRDFLAIAPPPERPVE